VEKLAVSREFVNSANEPLETGVGSDVGSARTLGAHHADRECLGSRASVPGVFLARIDGEPGIVPTAVFFREPGCDPLCGPVSESVGNPW
jgi:hypothetical protein